MDHLYPVKVHTTDSYPNDNTLLHVLKGFNNCLSVYEPCPDNLNKQKEMFLPKCYFATEETEEL